MGIAEFRRFILNTFKYIHNRIGQYSKVWFEFLNEHVHTYSHHVQRGANLMSNVTHLKKGIEKMMVVMMRMMMMRIRMMMMMAISHQN